MRLLFSLIYAVVLCAGARGQAREITVAADGSGQFTSVQKAVDSAPSHSRERSVIHIKPGIYRERVTVPPDKTFLTLHGDDAMTTVITFDMHPMPNPNGGRALITFDTPTVFIQANDFTAENITFENSAGRQGQALALTIMSDRGVFRYCRFLGFQDTLLAQAGRQYFDHCYIQGATDFIFGGSAAYLTSARFTSRLTDTSPRRTRPRTSATATFFRTRDYGRAGRADVPRTAVAGECGNGLPEHGDVGERAAGGLE